MWKRPKAGNVAVVVDVFGYSSDRFKLELVLRPTGNNYLCCRIEERRFDYDLR